MRIVYLSIGRHVHTERWIRYFAQRGHDCHLLTVQPGPIDGVTVHDITSAGPGKPVRYWRSLQVVRAHLAQLQPSILHTHFLTGYGYWGAFSGFRPNVLTVWGDDVYVTPHENAVKKWLAQTALRRADAITGDSVDILKDCVELGADADRCYEVQWGVDFDRFRPQTAPDVRERLGIPRDAQVILSPRSFTQPYYNIDVIIEATARALQDHADAHVIFSGYEGDPTPFVARAKAAGLEERAHFVGRIPHDEFHRTLAASDIFVSVPSVDATAVSLLESMAMGCGIIVSSLASAMEWIVDGENGLIVAPRDEDALVKALDRMLTDRIERKAFGERCVREVLGRADHFVNMDRMERLYLHLAEGAPVPNDLVSLSRRLELAC